MYLHKEDRELLRDIIITVSERSGIEESIVEKDYYVTMILKELTFRNPDVVFKGGTSLSKAYQVIERFSERREILSISSINTIPFSAFLTSPSAA